MHNSPEIVIGYHGCDQSVAEKIFSGEANLKASENEYDWLGNGIYFWEGSHDKALKWAEDSDTIKTPAVVGAFIRLGNCLDLLDIEHIKEVERSYAILEAEYSLLSQALPSNTSLKSDGIRYVRKLDCLVIERLHKFNNDFITEKINSDIITDIQSDSDYIDSVRGLFQEGDEIYENAGFRKENHIQLCIKNPNCIVGYFRPKEFDPEYKII